MKKLYFVLICMLTINAFGQSTDTAEIKVTQIRPVLKPLSSEEIHGGETWYALGNFAWMDFVKTNLKYPKRALKKNIQGTVKLKFRLTRKGKIRFIRIVGKRLGNGTNREAKRIVKLSQHGGWWIKEDEKGRAKHSKGTAEVEFKLNLGSK
jgi:TonB family protein